MFLTKIWTVVLSCLATACLAGMFLLSSGHADEFKEADREALRSITEAGLAALAADIQASPVSLGPSLLRDPALTRALKIAGGEKRARPDEGDLQESLDQIANETLLQEQSLMTVGFVSAKGEPLAATGLGAGLFSELTQTPAFRELLTQQGELPPFSATLGARLHAVKLSRPVPSPSGARLVAIQAVDIGAGSFLHRVLGASNPAALVRDGKLVGDALGGADPEQLALVVREHSKDVPPDSASAAYEIGTTNRRLASLGRVPGAAGTDTFFVVLSLRSVGSGKHGLVQALNRAKAAGGMSGLPWVLLLGLLVLSLALSLYLPQLESAGPLRRLKGELEALGAGRQAQIFYDTYSGAVGELAQAVVASMTAQKMHWDSELSDVGPAAEEQANPTGRRRPISSRNRNVAGSGGHKRRHTGSNQSPQEPGAAIDLPDAPEGAELDSHRFDEAESTQAPATPPADSSSPAPRLTDEVSEDANTGALSDLLDVPGAPEPTVELSPADSIQAHFKEVFEDYVAMKERLGESAEKLTFNALAAKLERNRDALLAKPGTKDVRFTVYAKDGKAALKAKVIKE